MGILLASLEKYAKLLVEYSVDVDEGEDVLITGGVESLPLLRELAKHVLLRGGYPSLLIDDDVYTEIYYRFASRKQLEHVQPVVRVSFEEYDARIVVLSPSHTKPLANIDPEKQAVRSKALRPFFEKFLAEAATGKKKWVIAPYPTLAMAQEAGMSPIEFEEFVYRALKLDTENPIESWKVQARKQARIIEILSKTDELQFKGPGIDLSLKVGGRKWINDDGRHNMPGGEVFTGPIEDSVEGCVRFDYPAIYRGREVEGVKLCFSKGVVVEYDAVKGRDLLEKLLSVDDGAKRVGEIAFGLNYSVTRATKEILFDEKIGGTIHLALGAGYPETGSQNKSSIHWDLIKDMKASESKVYADGELVYEKGRFKAWSEE